MMCVLVVIRVYLNKRGDFIMRPSFSDEKVASLERIYNEVDEIKEVIKEIQGGTGEVTACRRHGIDVNYFRRFCKMKSDDSKKNSSSSDILLSWQEEFLHDVYGEYLEVKPEFEEFWEGALSTLKARERRFIEMYYKEGYTQVEIAEKFSLSTSRVGTLIQQALRRIRGYEATFKYRSRGIDLLISNLSDTKQKIVERYKGVLDEYNSFLTTLGNLPQLQSMDLFSKENPQRRGICKKLLDAGFDVTQDISSWSLKDLFNLGLSESEIVYLYLLTKRKAESDKPIDAYPINAIGLSHRAYNVLWRAGYHYLSELNGKSIHEISRIRNCGKTTLAEITAKCKEKDIDIR